MTGWAELAEGSFSSPFVQQGDCFWGETAGGRLGSSRN